MKTISGSRMLVAPWLFLSAVLPMSLGAKERARSQQRSPNAAITWTQEQIVQRVVTARAGRKLTPESWPDGARVAVALTFDVDNETLALARGNTAPVALSAGEFGAVTGLPRVLDLLDRHDVPASFYIPAVSAILHPQMIEAIVRRGRHEIGVHGWIHEDLVALNDAAEEGRLLQQAIDYLTEATGRQPVGYRAPSWAFSPYTLDQLRAAGFLYDSSMMAMDEPYEVISHGEATGLVELPVDWILDDYPYFGATVSGSMPSGEEMVKVFMDEFDAAYDEGTMLMLTFHPHVIGHRSRMKYLDRLVSYMKSRPGVWFATGEQIANYVKRPAG